MWPADRLVPAILLVLLTGAGVIPRGDAAQASRCPAQVTASKATPGAVTGAAPPAVAGGRPGPGGQRGDGRAAPGSTAAGRNVRPAPIRRAHPVLREGGASFREPDRRSVVIQD